MSSEIEALSEIKGRCIAMKVKYVDTCGGVDPVIDLIDKFLQVFIKRPLTPQEAQELAESLYGLREYLKWLLKEYPEVTEAKPLVENINWLLTTD